MPGQGGLVLWEGPSKLDAAPLVVIITLGATNRKTGAMDQSWILRSDMHPLAAVRCGKDRSICGDCLHRKKPRSCYVTVQHGPAAIWRAYKAGKYPKLSREEVLAKLAGRFLRIGSYGDPMMVPVWVWERLVVALGGWTGYTSQWANDALRPAPYRQFLMASVKTYDERDQALAEGWRTFRTRMPSTELLPGEIVCPASEEAGHKLQCIECRICAGLSGARGQKSVAIYAHGPGKMNFFRNAQEALRWGRPKSNTL